MRRPAFAFLCSLNNLFKQRANIAVLEIVPALLESGLFNDFRHDPKIIERLE